MQFINPQLWWLALLAILPVVLYLFRRKSKTHEVSTLVFFKTLAREHRESSWLRRLKRILSLLLTLLLLLGAVSALVRIVFSPVTDDTRNVVILLDRSASMRAEDGSGETRMELAKSLIKSRLEGLSETVGVSLIAYDARPEIIQPRTLKRRAFLAELEKVEVRPVSHNLDAALESARTLARLETPAEIWHVSDLPAVGETLVPAGVEIVPLAVGIENAVNVGFTAFQIRKLPLQSSRYTAFLQVTCNEEAPGPVEGRIEVRVGGVYLSPRLFELEPGESKGFELPIDGAEEQLLQLTLHAENDVLSWDNAIVVPLPESQPIVAARVSDDPDPFTHLALQSLVKPGDLNIWSASPEEWPVEDVDVVIFENWLPEEWPADMPAIVINPPRSVGPVRSVKLEGGGVPHPDIRVANEDHPVLFRVSSSRLSLTQTCVFDSSGSVEPLWFAGNEPVLAAGSVDGQRLVLMGFAPQLSERLPLTASFPILMGNAIYWCAEGESAAEGRLQERATGDVVAVGGSQMRWTQVRNGKLTRGSESIDGGLVELDRVGVWETDEGQRGTAHLLSRDETNIRSVSGEEATAVVESATTSRTLLGDITWLILTIVLVLLIVESPFATHPPLCSNHRLSMDWQNPYILLLAIPLLAFLFWFDAQSHHPMSPARRRLLLMVRSVLVLLVLLALASPAWVVRSQQQAVVFVLDHSQSLGEKGLERIYDAYDSLKNRVGANVRIGVVSAGDEGEVLAYPGQPMAEADENLALMRRDGAATNLSRAVTLASAVFPAGTSRHLVLLTDGQETAGSLEEAARAAAVTGVRIHALPISGEQRPDVRVTNLLASQSRISEGATVDLTATIEASIAGEGRVRLFENGLEVDSKDVALEAGEAQRLNFRRSPKKRNIYNYRAVVEGFEGRDAIPDNNEALAIVDVRGKPLMLYVEGEEEESRYLVQAMAKEGIRLDVRSAEGIPENVRELAGYDAIIFSDIAAHEIGEGKMAAVRDYVDKLGGGFVMIGGTNSFGVGGYYRTPIEEILPVKLKGPDQEEQQSSALALVVDRSGSMSGQKIEICKSAAIATAELLNERDYIGVYAFDSQAHTVVPMTRVSSTSSIANQISMLSSGGGTNIYPGMSTARAELGKVKAKIKHMIVLTDGQTSGQGYQSLAAQCNAEGITISTVAVGSGAQIGLLQAIAAAGGGKSYVTMDPTAITRIFTQDTMMHTGRLIREEPFQPELVESHPMLRNWEEGEAPPLLGYVKTNRKATSQVPLVTDAGDPLLAHWRYGLGKVTAFTSDAKSRWGALWVSSWDGYSKLWAQILRETARKPQGRNMDVRLEQEGEEAVAVVDLMEDAGTPLNDAQVEADIFFVPANALGSSMDLIGTRRLEQRGPGLYEARFRPDEPGVYLVRARSGAKMVSAGHVHNPSGEVSTGQVNRELLSTVTKLTGGELLESAEEELELSGTDVSRYIELWPYLMMAFLALLLVDVAVRRWENVLGMWEVVARRA